MSRLAPRSPPAMMISNAVIDAPFSILPVVKLARPSPSSLPSRRHHHRTPAVASCAKRHGEVALSTTYMCARLSLNEPSGHSRQRETNQNANLTQSDANEFREVSIVPVNDRSKTDFNH